VAGNEVAPVLGDALEPAEGLAGETQEDLREGIVGEAVLRGTVNAAGGR
jgi:hypothetical protein